MACSVRKDKFLNRNFHAVTTEYNVLYNGNIALEKGIVDVKATYQDNFWELLPVERMAKKEKVLLPEQTKNLDFEHAEEKAVKAIQKHSMNIAGTEKNPQMDEAYLLLAKARYYDNRFIPALEALNYILYKYPLSDRIYHAKVWREKVNIRLDNEEVAIKNLKKLLEDQKITSQDLADANAMLTQAYMNIQAQDSAIATIKIAKATTKNKEESARYTFILGQLYEAMEYPDSAHAAFEEVIQMKRQAPRRYIIQAQARQAQQFDYKNGDTLAFVAEFKTLLEDRENRPFLDVLNHQMALFYDRQNKNKTAQTYYNKSIKAAPQDPYLMASNYRNLAEIYFREAKYSTAGKYYDSTLVRLDNRSREFRKIKKKRVNLDDVIKYEALAKQNDSILSVVAMNEAGRKSYYEKHIENLKSEDAKKAKLAAEKAAKEANLAANKDNFNPAAIAGKNNASVLKSNAGPSDFSPGLSGNLDNNSFYFYNPTTVEYGKNEFTKKWGKRELKDNWKWSNEKGAALSIDTTNDAIDKMDLGDKNEAVVVNPLYEVSYYLDKIPTDEKLLESLAKDRNFAYYQLGLIYKEKFKEYELAAARLEQVLLNKPEERLILPSKYNLYKIYQIIAPEKAALIKQQISTEYPNSRYAEIVKNPAAALTDATNPEVVYYNLFKKFENNQIREVSLEIDERINQYTGEDAVAKFELLKAKVVARLEGLDAYKKALNFTALTYPNSAEGKQAEELLEQDIPKLEALDFGQAAPTEWKIIFPKQFPLDNNVKNLTDKIDNYLTDTRNVLLKTSTDLYTSTQDFIVIHGLQSKDIARSVLTILSEHKNYKIKDQAFLISTEEYKIVQMKKKFDAWLLRNQ